MRLLGRCRTPWTQANRGTAFQAVDTGKMPVPQPGSGLLELRPTRLLRLPAILQKQTIRLEHGASVPRHEASVPRPGASIPRHGASGPRHGASVPASLSIIIRPHPPVKACGVMGLTGDLRLATFDLAAKARTGRRVSSQGRKALVGAPLGVKSPDKGVLG